MPLFDIHCPKCDASAEVLLRQGEIPRCPTCDSTEVQRPLGLPSYVGRAGSDEGCLTRAIGDSLGNKAAAAKARGEGNGCC